MREIALTYSLSETEFMRAARVLWSYEAIGDRGNMVVAIFCTAIGPVLLLIGQPTGWLFLCAAVFFCVLTWARNVIWRKAYRRMEKYRAPISVRLNDGVVSTQSAQGSADLPWTFFNSYAETPDYFFLTAPKRSLSIIPKSAFVTEEDIDQARTYIAAHLPRKKMRWT
ncbi:MAG: YcxB family protein [Pseudomonadota bacterium]